MGIASVRASPLARRAMAAFVRGALAALARGAIAAFPRGAIAAFPRGAVAAFALVPLLGGQPAAAQAPAGASPRAWAAAAALSRGIAVQAWRPDASAGGAGADAQLVSAVAEAGFRSVQLPWPAPSGAMPSEADWQRLDRLVDAFLARGLAVVLHDRDGPGPACAVDPRGAGKAAAQRPAPASAAAWHGVARRHAGRSARLSFMLSMASQAGTDAEQANRRLRQLLAAIRASDPGRPVIIGWGDAINLPRLRLPADPHLLVAVVNREPERFTQQSAAGPPGSDGSDCCNPREAHLMGLPLDLAQAWSRRQRVPVWLSAFGTTALVPAPARARHARLMREGAEARGLAWAYCALDGEFGLRAGSGEARARLRDALLGP